MSVKQEAEHHAKIRHDIAGAAVRGVARGDAEGIAKMSSGARPTNEPEVPGTPIDGDYPRYQRWGDPVGAYPIAPKDA